jgi:hypothetical protein
MHRSYVEVDARHFLHIISTHQASPRICAAHTLNASLFGGSGCKGTGSGRRVAAFEWRGAAVVELQNTHTHTHTQKWGYWSLCEHASTRPGSGRMVTFCEWILQYGRAAMMVRDIKIHHKKSYTQAVITP